MKQTFSSQIMHFGARYRYQAHILFMPFAIWLWSNNQFWHDNHDRFDNKASPCRVSDKCDTWQWVIWVDRWNGVGHREPYNGPVKAPIRYVVSTLSTSLRHISNSYNCSTQLTLSIHMKLLIIADDPNEYAVNFSFESLITFQHRRHDFCACAR